MAKARGSGRAPFSLPPDRENLRRFATGNPELQGLRAARLKVAALSPVCEQSGWKPSNFFLHATILPKSLPDLASFC